MQTVRLLKYCHPLPSKMVSMPMQWKLFFLPVIPIICLLPYKLRHKENTPNEQTKQTDP